MDKIPDAEYKVVEHQIAPPLDPSPRWPDNTLMLAEPQFYFNNVSPYLQTAIRYLNVTSSGRKWIATLYSNVFRAQRELRLSGPQH